MKKLLLVFIISLFFRNMAVYPDFQPAPTSYPTQPGVANPYVPYGQLGSPVSKNAIPIPMTPIQGGTRWINNTYGYTYTPNYSVSPQVSLTQFVPNPTPVPTPTQSGGSGGGGGGTQNPETTYVHDPTLGIMVKLADLQRRQAEAEARIRSGIESGYSSIMGRLDKMAGLYPGYQAEDIARLQGAYDTLLTGIGQQRESTEQKLGTYRTDIETQKKTSMDEISENLRNLLKATGMQLGAMGAGSSSALQIIAPFALGKQAARAGAQVIRDANAQLAEIDRKFIDVKSTYDSQINQLGMWLNDQKQSIIDRYRSMKEAIDRAKISADESKMQALAALDQSLLNNVQNQINNLETTAQNYRLQVQEWATNRIAQLQDFKLQLAQSGNFSPQQLTYEALVGLSGMPQVGTEAFYNPLALQRKKVMREV